MCRLWPLLVMVFTFYGKLKKNTQDDIRCLDENWIEWCDSRWLEEDGEIKWEVREAAVWAETYRRRRNMPFEGCPVPKQQSKGRTQMSSYAAHGLSIVSGIPNHYLSQKRREITNSKDMGAICIVKAKGTLKIRWFKILICKRITCVMCHEGAASQVILSVSI